MTSRLLHIVVLLLLSGLTVTVFGQDALKERFLTEAPLGWSKIRKHLETNVSVDAPSGEIIENGKRTEVTPPLQIRLMGRYELFTALPVEGESPEYLDAINDEYSFSLRRNTLESPFEVDDISYETQKYRTKHQWRHNHLQGCVLLFEGIMLEEDWLEDFFKSPGIKIIQIDEIKLGSGEQGVEVVFQGRYQTDKHNVAGDGKLIFLPEKDWALSSYTVQMRSVDSKTDEVRSTVTKTIEHQDFDSIPFPKSIRTSYHVKNGKVSEYVQNLGQPGKVESKDIFYLQHYGFGETEIKPASKYFAGKVVWAVTGFILILIGIGLLIRRRKKK